MKLIASATIILFLATSSVAISPAQAQTDSASKEIILSSWGNGAPEIAITVKGDWNYKLKEGPDFSVHYLTPNVNGDSVAIYVGHQPQSIAQEDTTITTIDVGTNPVTFYVTQRDGVSHAEAIIDGFFSGFEGSGVAALRVHIIISAGNPEQLAEIFRYIETLKPVAKTTNGN